MSSPEALRISHIVRGRERRGNRVVYFCDPAGVETRKSVAEAVVLYRWRRRRLEGYAFKGARLSPNLWKAVAAVFPAEPTAWWDTSEKQIASQIRQAREEQVAHPGSLPDAGVLRALFVTLGPDGLQAIIRRHTLPERAGRFGTPDLFLFAEEVVSGRPLIARFVEVKKPEEAVSADQKEEIEFLQSLGLSARLLRLIER